MPRIAAPVLVALLLVGLSGCLQEASAVDPWVTDSTTTLPDTSGDANDATADTAPATTWSAVQIALDPGESIVDWIGVTVGDVRTLFFLSDWGRLGRVKPGEPAETLKVYASQTAQAFRGLWTSDGKSFWVVGKGSTVWKGKPSLPSELSLKDDLAADWTGVWGDGSSVIWLTGEGGYFLRLDADGKNAQRFQQGTGAWRSPTGDNAYAWFASDTQILRVTNAADFVDKPTKGALKLDDIITGQTVERLVSIDPTHLYLVGKPYQLLRGVGEDALAFGSPLYSSGANPFFDLHGQSNGARLVAGVSGELYELDANDQELPAFDKNGLPTAEDLRRVWRFDDGSAYVLSAISGVYYRGPQL